MKKKRNRIRIDKGISLFLSIVLFFAILGTVVFFVARRLSAEMSASAIQNLSESLDLIKCTIESISDKEAEFQCLMAHEIANLEDPEAYIRSYKRNQTMVKLSLIRSGETEGISSTGESFSEDELDFSMGGMVGGLPVSQSYMNYMGTWAYTMKCPVEKDGREIGTLYVEYVYDSFDHSLPDGFYDGRAMLYIMDSDSERFVLKPKGMGERNAGHLNLEDFYRANDIREEGLRKEVADTLSSGGNILFNHDIREKDALNFMWSVNGGTIYLIGYVPIEAIQQEERTVNQNIAVVVIIMLVAFLLCCLLYYLNQRQQLKLRAEREKEREIHNQQLAEALEAAQAASNSKTTFLSNMSHDIRTPMNAVLGFTTLLAMDAEDPVKVREYTRKITASGQHLLSLINDILDISKIESGKVVLNVEEFTLNDLVSSVDAIIRPMAGARHQEFHVEVTGIRHEYLMGDETRVNQILINLLSNAVKYTQEGGAIWFRMIGQKQRSSQYQHIRIEVEDNGYGMTEEYQKKIFDAFTRAENSTTNKVQGTGLGMAITKNIVELMGGTIDVSSQMGQGSLFRVELEFRIPESHADQQFWADNGIGRLLAVDADPKACENICILLENENLSVETVSGLEEAVSLLEEAADDPIQVLLLDWTTALAEDLALVGRLRACMPKGAPLLILADYEQEGLEEALWMEETRILTKPFFVSAFKQKIREMKAGQSRSSSPGEGKSQSLEGLYFLAAEDNEINAEILEELLKMEGAGCEIVENGRLALERFEGAEEGTFDAILMDVQMPVMNGYEATQAIRALKREDAGRIPIIAMTANAFAEDERDALDAGMSVHLSKPIHVELLKEIIYQYVSEKGAE